MRLINSLKNMTSSFVQVILTTLLGFIVRSVFIKSLGIDYQGLNGLFSSILFMLSIAELGIGSAIIFNMYPFIAARDTEAIKSLMNFYRKCYLGVAGIVTAIGLIILPFLHFFSNFHGISENVYLLYLLYLSSTVATYLFSYKRSILFADQKNYLLNMADMITNILMNLVYLVVLLVFHSFVFYLLTTLVSNILENLCLNHFINKRYPYLKDKDAKPIDRSLLKKFQKQIYGMLYHNIGNFVVFGTDSMIITKFLGLKTMGIYSNYLLITNSIGSLLNAIISGLTASVGDLLTEKNPKKSFEVYKNISFMNFWLYSFASIGIYIVMQPFMKLWMGDKLLLPQLVLFFIVLNFYVQGMRKPIQVFQSASGIFYENRHIPVIEMIVNLVLSLIFVQFFGLEGILFGTLISTMILYAYSFPKYIYHPVFKEKNSKYVREQARYLLLFLFTLGISQLISTSATEGLNSWLSFLINLIISLIVPNLIFFLIFRKTKELKYFRGLLLNFIRR
ncbi:lipopolysaccharide biosynthesis protein [Lactococcus sp.]|uniref:lipopolysaccharide biosynthesis protein n=1 Tax=Lactococcus sp. TaxID=44273 RepID=UPI0035AF97E7